MNSQTAGNHTQREGKNKEGGQGRDKGEQMPKDRKRDETEAGDGGGKHSLRRDTQTCACHNKIPRFVKRKFTRKTKRRGA